MGGTPRAIAAPGPDGAVATAQLECLKEGTQDAEAMLFMREALRKPELRAKLGEELAKRCEAAITDHWSYLELGLRMGPRGANDLWWLSSRIHALAAEVAAALAAR